MSNGDYLFLDLFLASQGHQALAGQVVTLAPEENWTINTPLNPSNGTYFAVKARTFSFANVVVQDVTGATMVQNWETGQSSTRVELPIPAKGHIGFVYNDALQLWALAEHVQLSGIGPNTYGFQTPWEIPDTEGVLPIAFIEGDDLQFTESGGVLTAAVQMHDISFAYALYWESTAIANNVEVLARIYPVLTGGSGVQYLLASGWSFQTSRSGTFYHSTFMRGFVETMMPGDTIELRGVQDAGSMVTDITQCVISFDQTLITI